MTEEAFKDRLRRYRERKKLTRAELHRLSGVGLSLIGHYETGEIENPGADKVLLLARALGVTPATLMFGRPRAEVEEQAKPLPPNNPLEQDTENGFNSGRDSKPDFAPSTPLNSEVP